MSSTRQTHGLNTFLGIDTTLLQRFWVLYLVAFLFTFTAGAEADPPPFDYLERAENASDGSTTGTISVTANDLQNIRHVIFMLQENRSFDNYFGRMGQYRRDRGFNDAFDELPLDWTVIDANGIPLQPFHLPTVCTENTSPAWSEAHFDVHRGLMDRFAQSANWGDNYSRVGDTGGTRAMGYYDWSDLPYYYELAFQFATSDRWFSSVLANTATNRMYMFGATSFGRVHPRNNETFPNATIFDRLDDAGVSWRYYYVDANTTYLDHWNVFYRDRDHIFPISQYFTDLQDESTMPNVVFIERGGGSCRDEHPTCHTQIGAAYVKSLIDELMSSPTWPSSVFFLSYDEPGGLLEHVPPVLISHPDGIPPQDLYSDDPPGDFNESGMRVPVMVVSPWVRPHFVSHVNRDMTSMLKFIETRFSAQPLTARDGDADNMLEFFDFSSPYWLTPPPLPPQPTNGTCDQSLEIAPGH